MLKGVGLGYRPEFYDQALAAPKDAVDWYEVVSENFFGGGGRPRRYLLQCREKYPMAMHGVGLSVGSFGPLRDNYLKNLKQLVDVLAPTFVSDHICWTSHRGKNSHDLLPVPYTKGRLTAIVEALDQVQNLLGRRFYLENPSAYVAFQANDYDEAGFISELVKRSGAGLLLDINNLYVNHRNLGYDATAYLRQLKAEDICYFHLAGHSVNDEVIVDTHDHHICDDVWELYRFATGLFPTLPTLVEWDDNIPEFEVLAAEVAKARHHQQRAFTGEAGPCFDKVPSARLESPRDDVRVYETFYSIVTGPEVEEDPGDLRLEILSTAGPTPRAVGAGVYSSAYFLRLRDCLKAIFPTLSQVFNCHAFDEVVKAYLAALPPEEASITRVGARFATFLAEGDLHGNFGVPRQALADIARLEWMIESLYDLPDNDAMVIAGLAEINDEAWGDVQFLATPSWGLVKTSFDVKPVLLAARDGQALKKPEPRDCTVIVYRRAEEIYWDEISAEEGRFITHLSRGRSFLGATEALAADRGADVAQVIGEALEFLKQLILRGGVLRADFPNRQDQDPQVTQAIH